MTLKEELRTNGFILYKIKGDSMNPLLKMDKTLVYIESSLRPLKCLDIVLYERDNKLILHRVFHVNKKKNTFNACGDNRYHIERNIPSSNVLGVLTKIVTKDKEYSISLFKYKLYGLMIYLFYPIRALFLYTKFHLRRHTHE